MNGENWEQCVKILGLEENAGFGEIQARYRRLVLKYHPDINKSQEAVERFREIVEAYGTLIDLVKKREVLSNAKNLDEVCKDPRIKRMSYNELEMRLKYSSSSNVRAVSVYLIGRLYHEKAKRIVMNALKDKDEGVRINALKSLADIALFKDILFIIPLLRFKSCRIWQAVFQTVLKIMKRRIKEIPFLKGFLLKEELGFD